MMTVCILMITFMVDQSNAGKYIDCEETESKCNRCCQTLLPDSKANYKSSFPKECHCKSATEEMKHVTQAYVESRIGKVLKKMVPTRGGSSWSGFDGDSGYVD